MTFGSSQNCASSVAQLCGRLNWFQHPKISSACLSNCSDLQAAAVSNTGAWMLMAISDFSHSLNHDSQIGFRGAHTANENKFLSLSLALSLQLKVGERNERSNEGWANNLCCLFCVINELSSLDWICFKIISRPCKVERERERGNLLLVRSRSGCGRSYRPII